MSVYEYIIGAILIVFSLLIIVVVLFQEGRQANLGVISGAADSFMDKAMAKTWDARLAKWTKIIAIAFFVLVFAGMLVTKFLSNDALASYKKDDTSSTTSSTTTSASTTTTTTAATTTTTADEK
jgi:preprotein translocase subunit SecG